MAYFFGSLTGSHKPITRTSTKTKGLRAELRDASHRVQCELHDEEGTTVLYLYVDGRLELIKALGKEPPNDPRKHRTSRKEPCQTSQTPHVSTS